MFLDTDKTSTAIFISVTVTFGIASVFAAGRLISRFGIVKRHGWDDYTFIVAWVSCTHACAHRRRLTY